MQSAHKVLDFEQFRVRRERQRVRGETAVAKGTPHPLLAIRRLAFPVLQDLGHRPARRHPDKTAVGRQTGRTIHDGQRLVHHFRAITAHHVSGQIGIADVEVRLEGDDDPLELGRRGRTGRELAASRSLGGPQGGNRRYLRRHQDRQQQSCERAESGKTSQRGPHGSVLRGQFVSCGIGEADSRGSAWASVWRLRLYAQRPATAHRPWNEWNGLAIRPTEELAGKREIGQSSYRAPQAG